MTHNTPRQASRSARPVAVLAAALALSGCVRARMTVTLQPDGSGTIATAIGLTENAQQALVPIDEGDPLELIALGLFGGREGISLGRWTEGEYDWAGGSMAFETPEELNDLMAESDLFEAFDVRRRAGFLKSQYTLDARTAPFLDPVLLRTLQLQAESIPSEEDAPPEAFDFEVWLQLPGQVVDSNATGTSPGGALIYRLTGADAIELHASSVLWHWRRIALTVAATLVVIVLIDVTRRWLKFRRLAGGR